MSKSSHTVATTKRLLELDLIKVVAVFLMVYTHVAMLLYNFEAQFFNYISDMGGYISFTLFLFVSGGTLPILASKLPKKKLYLKLLGRGVVFYLFYILLGTIQLGLQKLPQVALLQEIPIFADFIIAFALFFALGGLVVMLVERMNIWLLVPLFLIIYVIGFELHWVEVHESLVPVKSLLVGHDGLHRFPILQYSVIYVLGALYVKYRHTFSTNWLLALAPVGIILTDVLIRLFGFERWVPTPGFLGLGLVATTVVLLVYQVFKNMFSAKVERLLIVVGRAAPGVLVFHLFGVLLLAAIITERFNFVFLIIVTLLLIATGTFLGQRHRI